VNFKVKLNLTLAESNVASTTVVTKSNVTSTTGATNSTWTPPANITEKERKNLTAWVESFSYTGVLNISFSRPIEIPKELSNFNQINRTYAI